MLSLDTNYVTGVTYDQHGHLTWPPGTPVRVDIAHDGLTLTPEESAGWSIAWSGIAYIECRGPETPQRRARGLSGSLLSSLFAQREKFAFLAIGLLDGREVLLRVPGMLASELEAKL